jgi:hypothetical protein
LSIGKKKTKMVSYICQLTKKRQRGWQQSGAEVKSLATAKTDGLANRSKAVSFYITAPEAQEGHPF